MYTKLIPLAIILPVLLCEVLKRVIKKNIIYHLQATDDEGNGQSTVVPLKISLIDSNDNAPVFTSEIYRAVIDEGATKFEPPLQVQVIFYFLNVY